MWRCACDCGGTKITSTTKLKSGRITSCGSGKDLGFRNRTHGATIGGVLMPEYRIWLGMMSRARQKNRNALKTNGYSGIGVGVSKEWEKFENFFRDMGPRPSLDHSLDRIDNTKGYCKENCIWSTSKEQARNRTNTRFLEFNGEKRSFSEWRDRLGYGLNTINNRLQLGWSVEKTLTTPIKKKPYRGKRYGWDWETEVELTA